MERSVSSPSGFAGAGDATGTRGADLPAIPVVDVGPGFALATIEADPARAHRLLDGPTRYVPRLVLRSLDTVSRRWLAKFDNAYLPEIDAIAARLGRPGVHFFSIMYEWACTCAVGPSPEGEGARLVRVLDWRVPGLGRDVIAARVSGNVAGPFTVLTWPGFSGVIQGMAPGRFSAALNQAPLRFAGPAAPGGVTYPVDWIAARRRVWSTPYPTAAHVLREAFERCHTFREAKAFLTEAPIALPAIYSLAGVRSGEACVIERTEREANVVDGPAIAANHWQGGERGRDASAVVKKAGGGHWRGHARGIDSSGRARLMGRLEARLEADFSWLEPPVLNAHTRLVMVADAKAGKLVAQGIERMSPATRPLALSE